MPEPKLDLSSIAASAFNNFQSPLATTSTYTAPDDPWTTPANIENVAPGLPAPASRTIGTGLPKDWYRRQERVGVEVHGIEGFIFNRYTVYELTTERGSPVHRRYSEFVFLYDILIRRYPFRLVHGLPPKRIGGLCYCH